MKTSLIKNKSQAMTLALFACLAVNSSFSAWSLIQKNGYQITELSSTEGKEKARDPQADQKVTAEKSQDRLSNKEKVFVSQVDQRAVESADRIDLSSSSLRESKQSERLKLYQERNLLRKARSLSRTSDEAKLDEAEDILYKLEKVSFYDINKIQDRIDTRRDKIETRRERKERREDQEWERKVKKEDRKWERDEKRLKKAEKRESLKDAISSFKDADTDAEKRDALGDIRSETDSFSEYQKIVKKLLKPQEHNKLFGMNSGMQTPFGGNPSMQCMAPGMCFPNMMHQPSMFTQNRCMNGGYGSSMIGVHPGMMSGPMGCGSPLSMMGMMPRPLPMQFGSPLMGGRYGHLPYGSPLLSQSSSFGLNAGLGLNLGIGGLNFGIGANFGLQRSRYSHLTRPNVGLGIPGGYPIAPRFPRQRTPIALPFRGTSARR